jgi:hypothetical protein
MTRRLLLLIAIALAYAVFMLVPAGAGAVGPQPLPDAACNEGTDHARDVGSGAEHVAHLHDFDADGVTACYHRNPTYPPATSALE